LSANQEKAAFVHLDAAHETSTLATTHQHVIFVGLTIVTTLIKMLCVRTATCALVTVQLGRSPHNLVWVYPCVTPNTQQSTLYEYSRHAMPVQQYVFAVLPITQLATAADDPQHLLPCFLLACCSWLWLCVCKWRVVADPDLQ
jgi:hypothetical protein